MQRLYRDKYRKQEQEIPSRVHENR
jgi:hypothetical protein